MDQDVEDDDDWKEYVHGNDMLDMKLEEIMVRRRPDSNPHRFCLTEILNKSFKFSSAKYVYATSV